MITDKIGLESPMVQELNSRQEEVYSPQAEIQEALVETGEVPEEPETPEERSRKVAGVSDHLMEIVPSVGTGLLTAVQEVGNLGVDLADWTENNLHDKGMIEDNNFINDKSRFEFADRAFQPDTMTGQFTKGIVQFLAPAALIGKAVKGVKAVGAISKLAKAGAIGAAVDFAAFDPNDERLSNLVQSFPILRNPVSAYLAANPKDSRAEGRLKNALEGMGIGLLAEGLFRGIKAVRAQRVAKSIQNDANAMVSKANTQGLDLPELQSPKAPEPPKDAGGKPTQVVNAEEIKIEVDPKIKELKNEIKAERPSQTEVSPELPPLPKETLSDTPPPIPESIMKSLKQTTPEQANELLGNMKIATGEGKARNFSLHNLNTTQDVKKVIESVAETFPKEIDSTGRGVLDNADIKELSDSMGMTVEDLLSRKTGEAFNAEQIKSSLNIMKASGNHVGSLAKQIMNGNDSKIIESQFLAALDIHKLIQAEVSGIAEEAGRALKSFQMDDKLTGATLNRFYDDVVKFGGGKSNIKDVAQAIVEGKGSLKTINTFTKKSLMGKVGAAAKETWINMMLSGFKTQIVNGASNALTMANYIPEKFMAETSSRMFGATGDSIAKGETWATANALMGGIWDSVMLKEGSAIKQGLETFKTGASSFKGSTKIEFEKAISPSTFNVDPNSSGAWFIRTIGTIINTPTRMLEGSDEFFKAINYRMEVHAQAHRKGFHAQVKDGITDLEMKNIIDDAIKNPDESIQMEALHKARENTFTKPVEDVNLHLMSAESISDFVQSNRVLKIVAPFTKTALNLVEFSLNRTPFAKGLLKDIKMGGATRDTALGRVSIGMGVMGISAYATSQGRMTGGGPSGSKNLAARKALRDAGVPEYSINVGGKWHQYDRFEPFGRIMALSADASEVFSALSSERSEEAQDLAIKMGAALAAFVTPEFLVRNIREFMEALSGDERKLKTFTKGLARSTVPAIVRDVRKMVDPLKRETRPDPNDPISIVEGMMNEIRNGIPMLSDDLPPKRNIFGQKQSSNPFLGIGEDESLLGKANSSIAKEIQRLNMVGPQAVDNTEDLEYLKIDMPDKFITKRSGGVSSVIRLSPKIWDRYVELSGGIGLDGSPMNGENLEEVLSEQVDEDYPLLGSGERTDTAKMQVIKMIISTYRSAAKMQLFQEYPELTDELEEGLYKKVDQITGGSPKLRVR